MLWLFFPLLALVALAITLALPAQVAVGYVAVIAWIAFLMYLIFYWKDPVSQALESIKKKEAKQ